MSAAIRSPVERDKAWSRWFARCGARPPVERITYKRWPAAPLSASERLELWRWRSRGVTIEEQVAPVPRNHNAVLVKRVAPEPLPII